jgi:hypothetical protein
MASAVFSIDPHFRAQLAEIPPPDAADTVALVGAAALKLVYDKTPERLQPRGQYVEHRQDRQAVARHSIAPSSPNKHKANDMEASAAVKVGTFRKPRTEPITKPLATQALSTTLRAAYGPYAGKHKKVAQHAGIKSAKTAEAWSCGRNLPALEYFLELGRNSPAIQKMTMRLWGLDADLDPEYSRVLNDLRQLVRAEGG